MTDEEVTGPSRDVFAQSATKKKSLARSAVDTVYKGKEMIWCVFKKQS